MKRYQTIFSIILLCLVNWTVSSQIEDFLDAPKPMAIDFKDDIMYLVLNSSGGPVTDGAIAKIDLSDENLEIDILVDNLIYPRAVIIVGDYLYYALPTSIRRINLTDQNPVPEIVVSGTNYPRAFSNKNNYLYLAENDKISKIDLTQTNFSKTTVIDGLSYSPLALSERNNELFIAYDHNVSKIDLLDPNPVLIDVLMGLDGKIYGMDFYSDYLYIEQTFTVPVGQKRIIKYDVTHDDFITSDVVNSAGGLTMIDIRFHENDIYIVYGGFGNKLAKVENADTLSLDEFTFAETTTLFPNPANDTISLTNLPNDTSYSIYDVNGKVIKNGVANSNDLISIEELNSGFYFIKLDDKNTFKFIKL